MDGHVAEQCHQEQHVKLNVHWLWVTIREDQKQVYKNDGCNLVKDVELVDKLLLKWLVIDQVSYHDEGQDDHR